MYVLIVTFLPFLLLRWSRLGGENNEKQKEFIVGDLFRAKVGMEVFPGLVRVSFLLRLRFFSCSIFVVNGLVLGIARHV